MSVYSESITASRQGSICYQTAKGLVPDINLAYDMEPPERRSDLLFMRTLNVLGMGTSYHEFLVQLDCGFLSVFENKGDRLRPDAGAMRDRVYLRDAIVEHVTDVQSNAKIHTLVLSVKPVLAPGAAPSLLDAALSSSHWRKLKFRTSADPKLSDHALTRDWEVAIQKHILFYNQNGVIITPDAGLVFELSREGSMVNPGALKMKTVFVNVCHHSMMPHKLKHGAMKEKHIRMICGPERILRGRAGMYNVIDVVLEPEAVELCLEDVDVKEEVAWIIARELRLRDRSISKVQQGSSVRFRDGTPYAGLNRDGEACGMLIDNESVRIFLLDNSDLSVCAQDLPAEEEQESASPVASFADSSAVKQTGNIAALPPLPCCVPYLVVKGAGCDVHSSADVESKKIGHLRKGETVYVEGRSSSGGGSDKELQDCWVKLREGGWVALFTETGVRSLHPGFDITHKLLPTEIEICSTNLMLKNDAGLWGSLFRSRNRRELDVVFTIRMNYPLRGQTNQRCEVVVQRTLEEFIAEAEIVKKRREKKQRRSSQLGTQPPDGPDAVLPAREDMTEDLLLLDDGASVLAEKVQTVQDWLQQAVRGDAGMLTHFLTPSKADWQFMESSLHSEGSMIIV